MHCARCRVAVSGSYDVGVTLRKTLVVFAVAAITFVISANAAERRTIFLDRMDGFESYIEHAIEKAELNSVLDVVEEAQHPDYKATLAKRFPSGFEAEVFKAKTGRNENMTLTLHDVSTGKAVVTYHFTYRESEKTKQAGAEGFVREIRKLLRKSN